MSMLEDVAQAFARQAPTVDFWSLRLVEEREEAISVRQGVLQPLSTRQSRGAFIHVVDGDGGGYAATADLTPAGLLAAVQRALGWARRAAECSLIGPREQPRPAAQGSYTTAVAQPWESMSLSDKIALLQDACTALCVDPRIVDSTAYLGHRAVHSLLVSSAGAHIDQRFSYIAPGLEAVANQGAQTQRRTGAGAGSAWQGGLERLAACGFPDRAAQIADEALALLAAPECPTGCMDVVLMPSQMVLQVHESIGHPLELDRILGDERNYAGGSFVTLDMFGAYRYGSGLLNVTFDPTQPAELASYGFDDEGSRAEKVHLIREGLLVRPLGGAVSQARSGQPGVANARASGWNRPPIDRMANLNLEPGTSTLSDLIGAVERGVLMETNRSWSIDDQRNKFQFGCEVGRLIENGRLTTLVRNPNYRGVSATFWRSLAGVGDAATFEVYGTPNCGKGEPNQMIHVGHAVPACLFRGVEVFGGTA